MKRTIAAVLVTSLALALPWAGAAQRSAQAKREFVRHHECPSTKLHRLPCPGFVIDHVVPLDCGGRDHWTNMQWQTKAEARAKDRVERQGPECRHRQKQ